MNWTVSELLRWLSARTGEADAVRVVAEALGEKPESLRRQAHVAGEVRLHLQRLYA